VARALPANAEPVDRSADRPIADVDLVAVMQIPAKEVSGPSGGVVAQLPRVAVDHRGDEVVDLAAARPGAARSRGVQEAGPRVGRRRPRKRPTQL